MENAKQKWLPEDRRTWLRKHHRQPLRERALEVLGVDGLVLFERLRRVWDAAEHGQPEAWERYARTVLRACGAIRGKNQELRRHRYITVCTDRTVRTPELTEWLSDPRDELDDDEIRAISDIELEEHNKRQHDAENELAVLDGEANGLRLLARRIGGMTAMKLQMKLAGIFDAESARGTRRMNTILLGAAKASTRHPKKYLELAIKNERDNRRKRGHRKKAQ